MPRQRLRIRGSQISGFLARVLVFAFAAGLAWYGSMLVLLALKVAPATIDGVSGYRDVFTYLVALTPRDITQETREITAISGALAALTLGYLTWRELPRAYLARTSLELDRGDRGATEVAPRAVERAVEVAALAHPAVTAAHARYGGDEITLDITARNAAAIGETLREVRQRARDSVAVHELGTARINVTLTAFDRQNRRELA